MNVILIELETAAIDAHRRGCDWNDFHRRHWREIFKAAGRKSGRSGRLANIVGRLLALVTTGNLDGAEPVANGWSEPMS